MTPAPIGSPWSLDPLPLGAWAYAPYSAWWWRAVSAAKLAETGRNPALPENA